MTQSEAGAQAPYTVFKADVSYYSGKLEAYLRYKEVPYEAVEVDAGIMNEQVYRHVGIKKLPTVRSAEGLWLYDTTPCIAWFERQHEGVSVFPEDPALRFLALLIEDYGDEWLWRPAMWWRWEPIVSRLALGRAIGEITNLRWLPASWLGRQFARRQRRLWLWDDGVTRENAAAVRQLYLDELDFLQALFDKQPYMLGSHPSVADFGYFASMFRHFGNDPDPAEVMRRRAPAVYAWTARLWNERASRLDPQPAWVWPDSDVWSGLWARVAGDYLPYLQQNAQAFRDGRKRFDFRGQSLSFAGTVTDHYRVWCRQELQRRYHELDAGGRDRVEAVLDPHGGLDSLLADGEIDAGLDERFRLPKRPGNYRHNLRSLLIGHPRNVD